MEFGRDKGDSRSGYLLFLHGMRLDIESDRITGIVQLFVLLKTYELARSNQIFKCSVKEAR